MAAKEFIVAIELGSSKMTGIAGQKNLDGSIQVLAVVKEDSSAFIRKGVVYNIDKTAHPSICRRGRPIYPWCKKCGLQRSARGDHRHSGDGYRTDGCQP